MNTALLAAIVLFLTGFFGDLATQIFGKFNKTANLFAPYWNKYGVLPAAVIAGCITIVFGGLFLLTALAIYRFLGLDTNSWSFVLFAIAIAFVLGLLIDVATNYGNWIPSLRLWYDTVGPTYAGLWSGGLAFALAALVTTVTIKLTNM